MKYPIPAYIFLGLFVLASIVQLFFAFIENQKWRGREKFLCLLFLGISAIFAFPNEPLIYCGAFLGMIGDILVLYKTNKKLFSIGSTAFCLGHICYIMEVLWRIVGFENILWWHPVLIVGVLLTVLITMALVCKFKTNHSTFDCIGQSLYFAVLISYIPVFAIALNSVGGSMYLSLIGAILFIISDCILTYTHFGNKFKRYDFYIMLPYLLAEVLIVAGFVLTLAAK